MCELKRADYEGSMEERRRLGSGGLYGRRPFLYDYYGGRLAWR